MSVIVLGHFHTYSSSVLVEPVDDLADSELFPLALFDFTQEVKQNLATKSLQSSVHWSHIVWFLTAEKGGFVFFQEADLLQQCTMLAPRLWVIPKMVV